NIVYSPTDNPADPINAPNDLTTTGELYVLNVGEKDITFSKKVQMPRTGAVLAVDPLGEFLVVPGNEYSIDPNSGNPTVHEFALMTAPLDSAGLPSADFVQSPKFPALLFNGLVVSPSGHLFVSKTGATPQADGGETVFDYSVEVRAQLSPGQWTVCSTL